MKWDERLYRAVLSMMRWSARIPEAVYKGIVVLMVFLNTPFYLFQRSITERPLWFSILLLVQLEVLIVLFLFRYWAQRADDRVSRSRRLLCVASVLIIPLSIWLCVLLITR